MKYDKNKRFNEMLQEYLSAVLKESNQDHCIYPRERKRRSNKHVESDKKQRGLIIQEVSKILSLMGIAHNSTEHSIYVYKDHEIKS